MPESSAFLSSGWLAGLLFLLDKLAGELKIRGQTGYRKSGSSRQFLSHLNNLPFTFMPSVVFSTSRITTFLFEI